MGAAVKSRRPEHNGFPVREDGVKKIEVHVAGVCARETEAGWKILAAKRKQDRSLHPGLWEGGGGHVHPGESFEAALLRSVANGNYHGLQAHFERRFTGGLSYQASYTWSKSIEGASGWFGVEGQQLQDPYNVRSRSLSAYDTANSPRSLQLGVKLLF